MQRESPNIQFRSVEKIVYKAVVTGLVKLIYNYLPENDWGHNQFTTPFIMQKFVFIFSSHT